MIYLIERETVGKMGADLEANGHIEWAILYSDARGQTWNFATHENIPIGITV